MKKFVPATKLVLCIGLVLARIVITARNGAVQTVNSSARAKFIIKFYKQVI